MIGGVEHRHHQPAYFFRFASDIGAEERLDDDAKRQLAHIGIDVERLPVTKHVGHARRVIDHDRAIRDEVAVMERRLHQPALPLPQRAVARQQPFASERTERALDQPRLVEFVRLLDEDLPREVGVIQLIDVQRAQAVVRDVAELARDGQAECEGIEWEQPRQHLADNGEQQVDARTGWSIHGAQNS